MISLKLNIPEALLAHAPSGDRNPEIVKGSDETSSISVQREPFFELPERQLGHYAQQRGSSELGRIFQVANGLHEYLDAIVVLGSSELALGTRALMQASCDPYHNEMSRAQRGSKPRVYFAGEGYDNDATSSLLERLRVPADGRTMAETRFGIIVCLDDSAEAARVALPHFVRRLESQLGNQASEWLPRLIMPVVREGHALDGVFGDLTLPSRSVFEIPRALEGPWSILSPAALLPAAFLGLDCMKLLEGAAAMNEHFRSAPHDENLVRQLVEALDSCNERRTVGRRTDYRHRVQVWEKSLNAVQQWNTALTRMPSPTGEEVCWVNWRVDSHRTDSLLSQVGSGLTFADRLGIQIDGFNTRMAAGTRPAIDLTLPQIDTFVLGQLFQFSMIVETLPV